MVRNTGSCNSVIPAMHPFCDPKFSFMKSIYPLATEKHITVLYLKVKNLEDNTWSLEVGNI